MTDVRQAPYPGDTRAKGWRFELDMDRFKRSDTWLRAKTQRMRAMLLLLWAEAWTQMPVGSLPADEELIALLLGMEPEEWARDKAVLMRGWWLADDGRLYHDVLVERVTEMMGRRRSDTDRQATKRARDKAKQAQGKPQESTGVTRDTPVTPTKVTPESSTEYGVLSNTDTEGRGHPARARVAGPVPENAERSPNVGDTPSTEGHTPTPAGLICRAIKTEAGFAQCNPGDPRLLALIAQGASVEEFIAVASEATQKAKGWAWILHVVEARRAEAATIRLAPKDTPPWHTSRSGIEAKGEEVGIGRWDQKAFDLGQGETFAMYQARVFKAAGHVNGRHADTTAGLVSVGDIAVRAAEERRRIWAERQARKEQRTNQ